VTAPYPAWLALAPAARPLAAEVAELAERLARLERELAELRAGRLTRALRPADAARWARVGPFLAVAFPHRTIFGPRLTRIVLPTEETDGVSHRQLGKFLARCNGHEADGYRLEEIGNDRNGRLYIFVRV
jgi:hypothetical protein